MTGKAFREAVEAHPDIVLLDVRGMDIIVGNRNQIYGPWLLPITEIAKHTWGEFHSLFTGRRGPTIIIHQSRVVGYFSRTSNWNRSKLAELKDRQKGTYAVPEVA